MHVTINGVWPSLRLAVITNHHWLLQQVNAQGEVSFEPTFRPAIKTARWDGEKEGVRATMAINKLLEIGSKICRRELIKYSTKWLDPRRFHYCYITELSSTDRELRYLSSSLLLNLSITFVRADVLFCSKLKYAHQIIQSLNNEPHPRRRICREVQTRLLLRWLQLF